MAGVSVRKRVELHGADELEVARRINTLRKAVRARHGAILAVRWAEGGEKSPVTAHVSYQIPLSTPGADPRTASGPTQY